MRWSSSYTRPASRSNAVWSPPLQAFNKPVISADRGSIAIPKKKISRPWPVFPSTSARSGGGGTENEDHTLGCHVGNGGSKPFCWTKRGAAKGDGERLYGKRPYILIGVRPLASAMFASIGVRIAWNELDSCPAEVGAIQVRLSHDAPSIRNSASEAALAFAQPYARTIVVFIERVRQLHRNGTRLAMGPCAGSRDHACPRRNQPPFVYWHHEGSMEQK